MSSNDLLVMYGDSPMLPAKKWEFSGHVVLVGRLSNTAVISCSAFRDAVCLSKPETKSKMPLQLSFVATNPEQMAPDIFEALVPTT
jgi:hypothetical protein